MKSTTDITDDVLCGHKRLYVDTSEIELPCPKCGILRGCGTEMFEEGDTTLNFYCMDDEGGCEHEWEVYPNVTASLTIEVDPPTEMVKKIEDAVVQFLLNDNIIDDADAEGFEWLCESLHEAIDGALH